MRPLPRKSARHSRSRWGTCLLVGLAIVGCQRSGSGTVVIHKEAQPSNEALDTARAALAKNADLGSCLGATRQLNLHLNQHPDEQPRAHEGKERADLQNAFGFDTGELAEIDSPRCTALDAHYLEERFLLRDAARALEIDNQAPQRRAEAAFAWAMRQVRLQERPETPIPASYVLRRGCGTSLERSLVVLGLFEQLGLDTCLVVFGPQDDPQRPLRVLVGLLLDKDLFLFDCGLGLPLPGATDGTIATLAQIRMDPSAIGQLTIDPKIPYDLSTEAATQAEVHLVASLSSLAPRMKYLESVLRRAENKITLATDLLAQGRKFQTALGFAPKLGSKPGEVGLGTRALRQFLPPEEGGSDQPHAMSLQSLRGYASPSEEFQLIAHRRFIYEMESAPWTALPPLVRALPSNVELGTVPRKIFMNRFTSFQNKPHMPRDLLLRGRHDEAISQLVASLDELQHFRLEIEAAPQLQGDMVAWCAQARDAQANLLRARGRVEQGNDPNAAADLETAKARNQAMWEMGHKTLLAYLGQAWSKPLEAKINHCTAQCKHEQAVRLQFRLDRAGAKATAAEKAAARDAWKDAADWWATFGNGYFDPAEAAAARIPYAEALAALGDKSEACAKLENLSGVGSALDHIARLYRAQQLRKVTKEPLTPANP